MTYEFLFEGTVVSHQAGHGFTRGVYTDSLIFPENSRDEPLTLRIVVTVHRLGTLHLDWKLTPRK